MRWVSDDFDQTVMGEELVIPDYPAELEIMGYFADPSLSEELDEMLTEAEMMGVDFDDPELMGAWLKNLFSKIKSRIQARRKKREAAGQPAPSFSIQTPQGAAAIGPGGVSWTGPQAAAAPGLMPAPAAGSNIAEMLKNPMVLAGIGGGLLLLMMMMKKRKGA